MNSYRCNPESEQNQLETEANEKHIRRLQMQPMPVVGLKLRQKDRSKLEAVLADLERGIAFVMSPNIALMRQHRLSSCDFFESQYPEYCGEKWAKITKEYGSEFVLAVSAARRLRDLLHPQSEG